MIKIEKLPPTVFVPVVFLGAWALYYLIQAFRWFQWWSNPTNGIVSIVVAVLLVAGGIGLLCRVRLIYWIVIIVFGLVVLMWGTNAFAYRDLVYAAMFLAGVGVMGCLINRRTRSYFRAGMHPEPLVEPASDGNAGKPPGVERGP